MQLKSVKSCLLLIFLPVHNQTAKSLTIDPILPSGYKEIMVRKDSIISRQYEEVNYVYMLLVGELSLQVELTDPNMTVILAESDETYLPVGWNGFNHPGRYTANVKVKSKVAQLVRWELNQLTEQIEKEQNLEFLKFLAQKSFIHLESSLKISEQFNQPVKKKLVHSPSHFVSPGASTKTIMRTFRKSPFLEIFTERQLRKISEMTEKRQYFPGEVIYEQGQKSEGFYILAQGDVRLERIKGDTQFYAFRSLSTPGFIVGWAGIIDQINPLQAIAGQETMLYYLSKENLEFLVAKDKTLGMLFYQRMLWLISNQVQITQARMMSSRFNHEVLSVRHLILHNRSRLSLNSLLHQVPHLLKHRDTTDLAFNLLHQINDDGKDHERTIASLSLDLLDNTKRELEFYKGLIDIYETVARSSPTDNPEIVRVRCAKKVQDVLEHVDHQIEGLENLPENGGNIFIYNHLLNELSYTLPNDFQITLDSHFISSMILFRYYNDPGVRVVRIAKGAEFAHQDYYRRLGYISVYTSDSDQVVSIKENRTAREKFYKEATEFLKEGRNIALSPEGTSNVTQDSPGELKFGAFKLALMQKEEPLIVPITLANFDKKVNTVPYLCRIEKPFKISDHISSLNNKKEVDEFLLKYRSEMRSNIQDLLKNAEIDGRE